MIARQTSKEVTSGMQRPLKVAPTRTLTANVCEMTHVSSSKQNRQCFKKNEMLARGIVVRV